MLKILALTLLLVSFTLASQYTVIVPQTATVDTAFTVKWTAPAGHSKYDYLTLYSGAFSGNYLYNLNSLSTTYLYSSASSGSTSFTFSDPEARYIVAYYSSTNSTAVAVSDIIEPSTDGYDISVFDASVYVPFNVEWTAKSPIGSDLEIVLYMVNSDTTLSQISFDSLTRGQSSGSSVFEVEQPGQYVVYLYGYYQTYQLASYYFSVSATGFELKAPSSASIFEEFEIDWVAPANHNIYDNINVWLRNDDGTVTQGTSVSVSEAGASSGTASLEVSTPGTYYVTYALTSGKIVATSDNFKVDVSGFKLSVPETVSVQTPFALTWYAPEDHYEYDSIYLYYVSADNVLYMTDSEYVYGLGQTSGVVNFTVDHPGTFVAKYLSSSNVFAEITVNATVYLYNIVVPGVAYIGQNLSVSWQAPALHSSADTIVIYFMDGQTGTTIVNSEMIPYGESAGVIDFVLYSPGEYFVAYLMYSQYYPYPYTQVIDLEYVYAAVSVYTVSAPADVIVDTPFNVNWTAPYAHNPSDQLSLALFHPDLNAFTTVDTEYLGSTSTTGVTSFTVSTAGEYVVFYTIQPSLDAVAASSNIVAEPSN